MAVDDLRDLIPPDTRRRNAALLAFVCVLVGALLMRGGERLVELRASGWGALGANASRARALMVGTTLDPPLAEAPAGEGHTGALTVICFPACDHVFDNGLDLGASPIVQTQVSAGAHRLKLTTFNPPATKIVTVTVATNELKTVSEAVSM